MNRSTKRLGITRKSGMVVAFAGICVVLALFSLSLASAGPITIPEDLVPGETARAADVNGKFTSLATEVTDNFNRTETNVASIQTNSSNIGLRETSADHDSDIASRETTEAHDADIALLQTAEAHDADIALLQTAEAHATDIANLAALLVPVGTVLPSLLSEEEFLELMGPDWVLADGRDVDPSEYTNLTGEGRVPDMRARFLRGLDGFSPVLGELQADSTKLPNSNFRTDTNTHAHDIRVLTSAPLGAFTSGVRLTDSAVDVMVAAGRTFDGSHSHSVSSGGDPETRPINVTVNFFVRIN